MWTAVYNDEQFIAVLDDFFRAVEPFVVHASQEPYEKQLISEMTTLILHHLHTPTFMESAFARAKKRGRLPWAYSSGGSVDQIASLYFRKSSPLKAETRSIQDELELFTFLIDTMKSLPPSITDSDRSLLFQTPTHVCLLLPRASLFQEAWNDSGFTYTWIRDQWLTPAREFYSQQLSKEEQKELYRRLQIEGELRATISLEEFVKELKHLPADLVASFLFQTLPLIPMETCQALLQSMELPPFLSSDELFRLLLRAMPDKSVLDVREYMHELKLAAPTFLFADTNWPSGYFSFIVHPVTKQLEVWKTDLAGVTGAPLPLIKSWFGKETWSIFWN